MRSIRVLRAVTAASTLAYTTLAGPAHAKVEPPSATDETANSTECNYGMIGWIVDGFLGGGDSCGQAAPPPPWAYSPMSSPPMVTRMTS